ncbi:MAG TPA: T9SS type A sorting domain-containing protein [candidate division WOR-3 bacterium]|uniref:T9SS type A sorting domain-containing protein n=1 Tax=candidate division WOR-3 bacterium TaxID=2052148 RepID=A0A9C9EM11_UNCW3|nr:T9SS type A sorting domain-containing protein [candidate division WOR-3 bacterium]
MKRLIFVILFFLPVMLSAQWENVGPEGAILYSLDSPQPGIFYAGGYGTGLWKSTDNGNSWSLASFVYETPIWDICASHQDPNLIFVLTAELSGWGYGETNLYKSTDGGVTWNPCSNPDVLTWPILVHPENDRLILACDAQGGAGYKSTDGGGTWTQLPFSEYAQSFGVHPLSPNIVFAGCGGYGGAAQIYKSTDYGATWTLVFQPTYGGICHAFAFDPVDTNIVYSTYNMYGYGSYLLKSTDRGESWAIGDSVAGWVRELSIDKNDANLMLAACVGGGVYKSTDGGLNWYPSNSGIQVPYACEIVQDPDSSFTYYIPNVQGFYKTTNAGLYWSQFQSGLRAVYADGIAFDPNDENTIYIASMANGVFKTTDGGDTWTLGHQGITDLRLSDVAVDPNNPQRVYTAHSPGHEYWAPTPKFFRSTDGGLTWEYTTNVWHVYGSTGCAKILVGSTSAIYFLSQSTSNFGDRDAQLFRSTDFGTNFSEPMDSIVGWNSGITMDDSENVYLCMSGSYSTSHFGAVGKSCDGGYSYTTFAPLGPYTGSAVDVYESDTNFAIYGDLGGNVYKTDNGGNFWYLLGNFVKPVFNVCFAPNISNRVVVGVGNPSHAYYVYYEIAPYDSGKIYYTDNGGVSWTELDSLPNHHLNRLVMPDDSTIYVTTRGGVYRYRFPSQGVTENERKPIMSFVSNITPNPFKRSAVISYSVSSSQTINISIYDITGRKVKTLVKGRKERGFYKANWEGTDDFGKKLPTGVYFVRLTASDESFTKKVILLR